MGSVKTWCTKEEVLKDLARASGRRVRDLDEGYLVIGDAPPPVMIEDTDDEMQLRFGEAATSKGVVTAEAPDLAGIQKMLRMVQEYHESDEDNAQSSDCVIAISKASKLNPNVKEFIPKSAASSSESTNSNKDISDNVNTNDAHIDDVNIEDSSQKDSNSRDVGHDLVIMDTDENINANDEFEEIATELKNKISDAAKSDRFEEKKQKNVAIATLLRLYANNTSPKQSVTNVTLMTPEYFEGKKDKKIDVNTDSVIKSPKIISPKTSTSSTPEPKNSSTTVHTSSSNSISSVPQQTSSENNLQGNNIKVQSPKIKVDPEIKRSIEKVNKWLEEPTKKTSPTVCLGPIAFKRKDPASSKSPVSDTEQKVVQKVSKPSNQAQRFQPSNYAADLAKKYMERNKAIEEQKKVVTWDNLDEILKQKDVMIKKRLEDQARANESNDELAPQR